MKAIGNLVWRNQIYRFLHNKGNFGGLIDESDRRFGQKAAFKDA